MARVFIFKPDGIGDFVLATGAIHALAREFGEKNLILCVKSLLVPLARMQFPQATVLDLPVAAERRVLNLFVRNFAACLPVWWRVSTTPVDVAVCLRSMRNYLETFLYFSARSRRHVACENILLHSGRPVRRMVEAVVGRVMRPELEPYPTAAGEAPMEIEANRRVVERVVNRPVSLPEVLPRLTARPNRAGPYWICAPVTNLASKLYPPARWAELFQLLHPEAAGRTILLTGSKDQRPALEDLCGLLHGSGCQGAEVFFPEDLTDYVNLIAGADLMLTVDTAAAHFATALDRPTLVLFSGLHHGMFGPWRHSARQAWLQPEFPPGAKKKKWHAGITPDRAAAAVRDILRREPPEA